MPTQWQKGRESCREHREDRGQGSVVHWLFDRPSHLGAEVARLQELLVGNDRVSALVRYGIVRVARRGGAGPARRTKRGGDDRHDGVGRGGCVGQLLPKASTSPYLQKPCSPVLDGGAQGRGREECLRTGHPCDRRRRRGQGRQSDRRRAGHTPPWPKRARETRAISGMEGRCTHVPLSAASTTTSAR